MTIREIIDRRVGHLHKEQRNRLMEEALELIDQGFTVEDLEIRQEIGRVWVAATNHVLVESPASATFGGEYIGQPVGTITIAVTEKRRPGRPRKVQLFQKPSGDNVSPVVSAAEQPDFGVESLPS